MWIVPYFRGTVKARQCDIDSGSLAPDVFLYAIAKVAPGKDFATDRFDLIALEPPQLDNFRAIQVALRPRTSGTPSKALL